MHPHKRIIPFLLLAIAVTASVAHAAGRFTSATATVTDGNVRQMSVDVPTFHGGLLVSFHEVGVSANQAATYNVTADCTATYACINRGGNNPKAANKTTVSGPVSATATDFADASGQVSGSIAVAPSGPGSFTCTSGQDLVLVSVSYTNVWIREPAHRAEKHIDGTFSLTLVDVR